MGDWSTEMKIMKERTIKVKYEREEDFNTVMSFLKSIDGVDVLEGERNE